MTKPESVFIHFFTMARYLGSKICRDWIVPGRTTIPIGKIGSLFVFNEFNYGVQDFFTVFIAHYENNTKLIKVKF